MKACLVLTALATGAAGSYVNNWNYRAPAYRESLEELARNEPIVKHSEPSGPMAPTAQLNFTHGVASGDPYADSVIIWTRLSPEFDNDKSNVTVEGDVPLYSHETQRYLRTSKALACADWKVAETPDFAHVVSRGRAWTTSEIDWTIKVEAGGLRPFTQYYYQFNVCGSAKSSVVGCTKTAPAMHDVVTRIRLAVYSCSNFPFGFFNAFGNPVRKQSVDYVVHLGDYYYEYRDQEYGNGAAIGRVPLPDRQIFTLYDYRKRLGTYRTDADLLLSHQHYAWIPVWDDHEVADNTYRDGASELNNTGAAYLADGRVSVDQRKMNAVRAYFEWMPIRQVEAADNLRIWRSFSLGSLLDLLMLDTRQYDRSITDLYTNTAYVRNISDDAGRSLMGARQERWFYSSLLASAKRGATWRIIGSQVVFSRLNVSLTSASPNPGNVDAWDGYRANRNRTLRVLYDNNIGNNIMLAGDSHENWVSDLIWHGPHPYNSTTGAGALGVEFAGTAVSSPSPLGANVSLAAANAASQKLVAANDELHWQEAYFRGYYELSVGHDAVHAAYFGLPTIVTRNALEIPLANFTVVAGQNRLQRPVGGGVALNGALKGGRVVVSNATNDTSVPGGRWSVSSFPLEVL